MPLAEGSSEAVISGNIAELIKAGHSQKQAEAIAYQKAGKTKDAEQKCRAFMLDKMDFYTPTELGKTRSLTTEGYLVCEGVAIARTGQQTYNVNEIKSTGTDEPLKGNSDNQIIVDRTPEEVFDDATIASFNGKSITVEHPNDFVKPENYKEHEVGHVQNVRRGTGIEDDLLLADFVIKDPSAIAYVNKELPEVSCGYDSEYIQTQAGRAIQRNIIGNHVALVDRGRAGPRCAIKDHTPEGTFMKGRGKFFDQVVRLFTAIQSKDEKEMEKIAKECGDEDPDDTATMDARLRDAEKWIKDRKARDEAEEKEKEKSDKEKAEKEKADKEKKEAEDAILNAESTGKIVDLGKIWTGDSLKEIYSRVEILAPGTALPTTDSAKTKGVLESLITKALNTADATEAGKECIKPFLMGRELKNLTGDALMGVFTGSAELMRQRNNRAAGMRGVTTRDFGKQPPSNAELNKSARERWASK